MMSVYDVIRTFSGDVWLKVDPDFPQGIELNVNGEFVYLSLVEARTLSEQLSDWLGHAGGYKDAPIGQIAESYILPNGELMDITLHHSNVAPVQSFIYNFLSRPGQKRKLSQFDACDFLYSDKSAAAWNTITHQFRNQPDKEKAVAQAHDLISNKADSEDHLLLLYKVHCMSRQEHE